MLLKLKYDQWALRNKLKRIFEFGVWILVWKCGTCFFYNLSHVMVDFIHLIALFQLERHLEPWISYSRFQGSTEHQTEFETATTWFQIQLITHWVTLPKRNIWSPLLLTFTWQALNLGFVQDPILTLACCTFATVSTSNSDPGRKQNFTHFHWSTICTTQFIVII